MFSQAETRRQLITVVSSGSMPTNETREVLRMRKNGMYKLYQTRKNKNITKNDILTLLGNISIFISD